MATAPGANRRRGARLYARDIMTTSVITARPQTPVKNLITLMTSNRISGIPIVSDDEVLVGIVTEADILYKYKEALPRLDEVPAPGPLPPGEAADRVRKAEGLRAEEIMTSPAITVTEDTPVHEIARLMVRHKINRLPVLRSGRVAGIVSRADLLKAFTRPDHEISEVVWEGLRDDLRIDLSRVSMEVLDGTVRFYGTVPRRSDKELIETWTGWVDGVVAVRSELSCDLDGL